MKIYTLALLIVYSMNTIYGMEYKENENEELTLTKFLLENIEPSQWNTPGRSLPHKHSANTPIAFGNNHRAAVIDSMKVDGSSFINFHNNIIQCANVQKSLELSPTDPAHSIALNPAGTLLASCHDKTVKIWDIASIKWNTQWNEQSSRVQFTRKAASVAFNTNNDIALLEIEYPISNHKVTITIKDAETLKEKGAHVLILKDQRIYDEHTHLMYDPSGKYIVACYDSAHANIIYLDSMQPQKIIDLWDPKKGNFISAIACDAHNHLFAATAPSMISMWDISTEKCIKDLKNNNYPHLIDGMACDNLNNLLTVDELGNTTIIDIHQLQNAHHWIKNESTRKQKKLLLKLYQASCKQDKVHVPESAQSPLYAMPPIVQNALEKYIHNSWLRNYCSVQ